MPCQIHLGCLHEYIDHAARDRQLLCPLAGCDAVLASLTAEEAVSQKLQAFLEEQILESRSQPYARCPSGCGKWVKKVRIRTTLCTDGEKTPGTVTCSSCMHSFCPMCSRPAHHPLNCVDNQHFQARARRPVFGPNRFEEFLKLPCRLVDNITETTVYTSARALPLRLVGICAHGLCSHWYQLLACCQERLIQPVITRARAAFANQPGWVEVRTNDDQGLVLNKKQAGFLGTTEVPAPLPAAVPTASGPTDSLSEAWLEKNTKAFACSLAHLMPG